MILIQKIYWKVVKQTTDKKYKYLFKPTYVGLEKRHLTKLKWK